MKRRSFLASIAAFTASRQAAPKPAVKPEDIVQEWMLRWTQLDGSDATAAKFAELYLPEGVHETGPNARQKGSVYYEGQSDIQVMAKSFGDANSDITFRINPSTANEKTFSLMHVADGPWGGPSIAIEYVAAYTQKKDKKRFMSPGAAIIQIQNGKIRRTRMYTPREEIMEILP